MKTKSLLVVIAASVFLAALYAAEPPSKKNPPGKSKSGFEKEVYELPKEGTNLPRGKGGWLNVQAIGSQLIVKFFDPEKKPVPPDVPRALARFRYSAKSNTNRAVLNREGEALVSPGNVRPPHNFLGTLTLLYGEDETAETGEVYNFKYP